MNAQLKLPVKLSHLFLAAVSLVLMLMSWIITTRPAEAVGGTYRGLKLPYAAGQTRTVTGTHNRASGRHALDLGMRLEDVLAIHSGTVYFAGWDSTGGGNMIMIDHGDNFCSIYAHLNKFYVSKGATVWQGRPIAKSGNTGGIGQYHLHFAVIQKSKGRCTGAHANEIAMIFDEKPNRELVYKDAVTSQNTRYDNQPSSSPRIRFVGNPVSTLWFDQNYNRINLKVCADNLPGKTVYVIAQGPAQGWGGEQQATGRCITMSGPSTALGNYKTWAGLNDWPDTNWPIPCYSATGGYGLCDKIARVGLGPTNAPTRTPTPTITKTLTSTPTLTATPTGTATPTSTLTDMPADIPTATPTSTSNTPTDTLVPTTTDTPTVTLTNTPTNTPTSITSTPTSSPTITNSPTPTSTPTKTPIPPFEVQVSIFGPGFESTWVGGWVKISTQNSVSCSTNPANVIYTRTRTVGYTNDVDWARWRPNLPYTGNYRVYVYIPNYSHTMGVTNQAIYRIFHANGQTNVIGQQLNLACNWVDIGKYTFNAGTGGYVYMGDYTGDNPQKLIAADAMKFVWAP